MIEEAVNYIFPKMDIINGVLGAVISLFFSAIFVLIKDLPNFMSGIYYLRGEYFFYHRSGTVLEFREKKILIKRYFFRIKIEMMPSQYIDKRYIGDLVRSKSSTLYSTLVSSDSSERIFISFSRPISPNFSLIGGCFCSVNSKYLPVCGYFIISRNKLTDKEIEDRIGIKCLLVYKG